MKHILILAIVLCTTCRKPDQQIPYVPVNLNLNLDLPQYTTLQIIGNWLYVSGGSKGIILYRRDSDNVVAFDRHCTYDVNANCNPAEVKQDNVTVFCSCDGSEYSIMSGAVTKGPASNPLMQYQTTLQNNTLTVFN